NWPLARWVQRRTKIFLCSARADPSGTARTLPYVLCNRSQPRLQGFELGIVYTPRIFESLPLRGGPNGVTAGDAGHVAYPCGWHNEADCRAWGRVLARR